jgi:hypothetical protein
MSQQHEELRPGEPSSPLAPAPAVSAAGAAAAGPAAVRPTGGGAVDPWASLSVTEDDFDAAFEEPDLLPDPQDDPEPDRQASLAAAANADAVDAAVAAASAECAMAPAGGGRFTIPLLCAGIAVIAACLIIPQTDANRRLAYERVKLQADLQAVEQQVETNDEFLRKVGEDPNLAERLAQRQMKIIREGNEVLNLKGDKGEDEEMSPFQLTAVAPPAELPPYTPKGGTLANLCYNPKSRLYLMGVGLLAIAGGLVLGFTPRTDD